MSIDNRETNHVIISHIIISNAELQIKLLLLPGPGLQKLNAVVNI